MRKKNWKKKLGEKKNWRKITFREKNIRKKKNILRGKINIEKTKIQGKQKNRRKNPYTVLKGGDMHWLRIFHQLVNITLESDRPGKYSNYDPRNRYHLTSSGPITSRYLFKLSYISFFYWRGHYCIIHWILVLGDYPSNKSGYLYSRFWNSIKYSYVYNHFI